MSDNEEGKFMGRRPKRGSLWRRMRLEVDLYLPDANPAFEMNQLERLQSAVTRFLKEHGYVHDPEKRGSRVFASWRWRDWFRRVKPGVNKEVAATYDELKEGLRREFLDKRGAEAFNQRATAAAEVIAALAPYDRAVMRLGDVLLIKATVAGAHTVVVETISPRLARALEEQPELGRDPEALLRALQDDSASSTAALPEET